MKRDMDLVRKILLKIEENNDEAGTSDLVIDKYSHEMIAYHCKMLCEEGLVDYYDPSYADGGLDSFSVGNLTWEGHDFLDSIRDDSHWNKVKKIIAEKGLQMTIGVIKIISKALLDMAVNEVLNSMKKGGL